MNQAQRREAKRAVDDTSNQEPKIRKKLNEFSTLELKGMLFEMENQARAIISVLRKKENGVKDDPSVEPQGT